MNKSVNPTWTREEVEAAAYSLGMRYVPTAEKTNQCGETCERAKLCAVCACALKQEEQT